MTTTYIETDKSVWLPPVHSMVTSYGSLNLMDLSRRKGYPLLVADHLPSTLEEIELIGQTSEWPRPHATAEDWKHALSHDMTDLLNDYYIEARVVAGGNLVVGLFHSDCTEPVDELAGPSVQALSVTLTNVWMHEQYHGRGA